MSIQTILTQFTGPYFVATVEDGQPRVRPFGLVLEHQGRIYFGVGDQKASYRQLVEQPAIEISAVDGEKNWLRLRGEAVFDDDPALLEKIFGLKPHLKAQYNQEGGPRLKPFYIKNGIAEIASLAGDFQSFQF